MTKSRASVLVSGMGVVTPFGVGVDALAAGLRRGQTCIAAPVRPDLAGLCAAAELGAFSLRDALAELGACPEPLAARARRCAMRAPLGIELSLFSALEA